VSTEATEYGYELKTEASLMGEMCTHIVPNLHSSIDEETLSMSDLSDQAPFMPPLMRNDTPFDQVNNGSGTSRRYQIDSYWKNTFSKSVKVAIICLAGLGILSLSKMMGSNEHARSHEMSSTSTDPQICDCGASTHEALSLNCQFVEMSAAWLPPRCIDASLSAEFDRSGPGPDGTWPYYSDASRQHPLTVSQVSLLADTQQLFYSTWEWHVKHCTFQWRLDYRRRWLNTLVEPRYDHESHVTHCEAIFLGEREKSVGSIVRLNSSNHMPKGHLHHEHGEHDILHD
jgi:hypothetical protein